jgi:hypothetical protein
VTGRRGPTAPYTVPRVPPGSLVAPAPFVAPGRFYGFTDL